MRRPETGKQIALQEVVGSIPISSTNPINKESRTAATALPRGDGRRSSGRRTARPRATQRIAGGTRIAASRLDPMRTG
jgi:hypothetical protein